MAESAFIWISKKEYFRAEKFLYIFIWKYHLGVTLKESLLNFTPAAANVSQIKQTFLLYDNKLLLLNLTKQ